MASDRITIRCRNCGEKITYIIRHGDKPSTICNKCDTRNINKKSDMSNPTKRRNRVKYMELY